MNTDIDYDKDKWHFLFYFFRAFGWMLMPLKIGEYWKPPKDGIKVYKKLYWPRAVIYWQKSWLIFKEFFFRNWNGGFISWAALIVAFIALFT